MSEPHPEDLSQVMRWLRAVADLSKEEMATRAGLDPSTIFRNEKGVSTPSRENLTRAAGAVGLEMTVVDACLLPAATAVRLAKANALGDSSAEVEQAAAALGHALDGSGHAAATAFLAALDATGRDGLQRSTPPGEADRAEVEDLWRRLQPHKAEVRRRLVERWPEFQNGALAERLSHESADAASGEAAEALELAVLAHRVAELAPGDEAWQARLEGYTLFFLANSRRVGNDMEGAETAITRALERWQAGAEAAPDLLQAWRVLDLEGSLRRDQRRFAEALDRLDQAFALAPEEAKGRILLKKAVTFEHMGDPDRALATLREAEPLVDGRREPHSLFGLRFNLAANLCHLHLYAEAEPLLPEIRDLATALGKPLSLLRVRWLEGRVGAGLGRAAEAEAAFEEVRRGFQDEKLAYDCALVSLDLAALHLIAGRTAAVRVLATEMVWIFTAKGIHREAQAALTLFCRAARQEAATAELARRITRYLEQARHDPGLRFET